jgi:hypothetical protein
MGILTAAVVAVLGLLGATLSKLLADEFKAWAPSLTSRILAVAARALPPSRHARCAEEWEAHVNETPGDLGRLLVACGCVLAAWKMKISRDRQERERQRERDRNWKQRLWPRSPENPTFPIDKSDGFVRRILKGAANREIEHWKIRERERERIAAQESEPPKP